MKQSFAGLVLVAASIAARAGDDPPSAADATSAARAAFTALRAAQKESGAETDAGKKVKVTREGFRKFADTYRQRVRSPFPFVVAADGALKDYVKIINGATLVLDEDRRIVLAASRFDSDSLRWIAQATFLRWKAAHASAAPSGK